MLRQGEPGPLLAQIAGVDTLTGAWRAVQGNIPVGRRGRGGAGSLATFDADWVAQMEQLSADLRTGRYQPLPPRRVRLPADARGKEREIAVLAVRDRVAQRAVLDVLGPQFDNTFADCSYGCRPCVGAPHAITRVDRYRQLGKVWAARADVSSFFDTIDHRILMGLLRLRIEERAVLDLIDAWLQVGVLETDGSDAPAWWQRGRTASAAGRAESAPTASVVPIGNGQGPNYSGGFGGSNVGGPAAPRLPGGYGPTGYGPRGVGGYNAPGGYGPAGYGGPGLPDDYGDYGLVGYGTAPAHGSWPQQMVQRVIQEALPPVIQQARPGLALTAGRVALRAAFNHPLLLGLVVAGGATAAAAPLLVRALQRNGGRGALQGGALSPLLANVYMDPFDRAMTGKGYALVRYVDDFVLLGTSRAEVEAALAEAQRQVTRLHLALNERKTAVCGPEEALEFLGHRFAPLTPATGGPRWKSFGEARLGLGGRRK